MNNYWKMNRIGFVNFWLYDEEIFEFVDGKLLLRGQNGSGKSITTQSFIPFILDGDRTPSRLDPFGSSDRRMEYYFLGEDGKDDSTGYLFLEFQKMETNEYRTIAIGQRARRGKQMDFWGFVILDGRRIGIDINVYKETGSTKLPYDRQEMKKVLGEETPFTDVPGEYKALVNKYLFGYQRPEQYEQFIKLLVKVRAPKLSKEFKPTKVYEILNESLQTLTDEELRAMVDAMEKMDGIQENLDQLRRTFLDVKAIRNEYSRYNRYMLARKGTAYLKSYETVQKLQQEYDKKEQEIRNLTEERSEKKQKRDDCEDQLQLIDVELLNLADTDMEEADLKLENARHTKAEAQIQKKQWDNRITEYRSDMFQMEQLIKKLTDDIEASRQEYCAQKEELQNLQGTLCWEGHDQAVQLILQENAEVLNTVLNRLKDYQNRIAVGKAAIEAYERVRKVQDELLEKLEKTKHEKAEKEIALEQEQDAVLECQDALIEQIYRQQKENTEWKIDHAVLVQAENKLRAYQKPGDAEEIRQLIRADFETRQDAVRALQNVSSLAYSEQEKKLNLFREELERRLEEKEVEPKRREEILESRAAFDKAGISCIPFYKAVEFAPDMTEEDKANLEAQLQMMGILDAIVIEEKDIRRVQTEFPEWADTVLCAGKKGESAFDRLVVSRELEESFQEAVANILSNIEIHDHAESKIFIGNNGTFRNGILFGRANTSGEAEYVGVLARKRKREQMLAEIREQIETAEQSFEVLRKEREELQARMRRLQEEYQAFPRFTQLDQLLDRIHGCELELQLLEKRLQERQQAYDKCTDQCNIGWQKVLQLCKQLPYGRTLPEYQEAEQTSQEYTELWREVCGTVRALERQLSDKSREEDAAEKEEEQMDVAFQELRRCENAIRQVEPEIRKYEEYLQREDIREKAQRLDALKQDKQSTEKSLLELRERIAVIDTTLELTQKGEETHKNRLQEEIGRETFLQKYFDEELDLKLVMQRENKGLISCAKESETLVKDGDRNREPEDILNSLHRVYQQNSSNLTQYGTTMEDCFEGENELQETRKRVRLVSTWSGKKLYLEEFYETIKQAIEETELLIQKKDRELFEDILSQTIGQQLTERIAESRKWVQDMSELMKGMDTSMGLSFSLSWKPKSAENDQEIDTSDLEQILLRDRALLTNEDIARVAAHFRSKIKTEKIRLEEEGSAINYMELVRDALDYRKWFEFQMFYKRNQEDKKTLTNAAFNRFSGGEKAMAMYVPLFAAVNAQYKKAKNKDHPRMIALDEAFAGVDDKNINSMFQLVSTLGFDYIMNSQALWGCYETVKGLKIADMQRPSNSQVVTVISYIWNGHERILDEG